MNDLSDHPFSPVNIARETGAAFTSIERAWSRWLVTAEKLIGHGLDGNDCASARATGTADGYSLDEAFDMFRAGRTPQAYVTMVATRERYRKPA